MLGVMPTRDAQRMADDRGLDLVEITPNAVKFKLADEGKTGSLVAKDDGLYIMRGFIIIVK